MYSGGTPDRDGPPSVTMARLRHENTKLNEANAREIQPRIQSASTNPERLCLYPAVRPWPPQVSLP